MSLREINLIPDEIIFRDNLFRHLLYWGEFLVILVVVVFGFNMYMNKKLSGAFNYLTGIQGIDSQLSAKVNAVGVLQEEIAKLDRQMEYAGSIVKSEACSSIISGFVKTMNRQTWLENFEITQGTDNLYVISLKGYSTSSESLGDFVEKLSKEGMFASVLLKYAKDAGAEGTEFKGGKNLISFQVEFKTGG